MSERSTPSAPVGSGPPGTESMRAAASGLPEPDALLPRFDDLADAAARLRAHLMVPTPLVEDAARTLPDGYATRATAPVTPAVWPSGRWPSGPVGGRRGGPSRARARGTGRTRLPVAAHGGAVRTRPPHQDAVGRHARACGGLGKVRRSPSAFAAAGTAAG
ncbi:hypothetical protein GCM10018793_04190 [Streptomyces sulfonofaciens]|uniref:Uncharacterized protein n=1 Tax=Streptomyces sulfonofaciens TaxID=68272 RepID=A0A919FQG6_9ACTN|nr:hypothetical protein GCM10018793_04190 [Streptomyces sulfonofaciens]